MSMQQFCLRWNNHQPNFISVFSNLLNSETLVDVTLAAEGRHLQAHKVVLSACSTYFQSLFTVNPCQHPIVILKDVKFSDLKIMVDFMYYGEVNVSQDQLPSIIKTAESLKIKGLAEMHTASLTKWPSGGSEPGAGDRGESCSPSPSPLSPSFRRKRLRKSSTGSTSGSGDKPEEMSEITLVATNIVKPEPLIVTQENAEGLRRPLNASTESQGSIDEDQISIMSNMENSSAATPAQSDGSMQDVSQQSAGNVVHAASGPSGPSQPPAHQGLQWTIMEHTYPRFALSSCQTNLSIQASSAFTTPEITASSPTISEQQQYNSTATGTGTTPLLSYHSSSGAGTGASGGGGGGGGGSGNNHPHGNNNAHHPNNADIRGGPGGNGGQGSSNTSSSSSTSSSTCVLSGYGAHQLQHPSSSTGGPAGPGGGPGGGGGSSQGGGGGPSPCPSNCQSPCASPQTAIKRKRSTNPQADENFIRALDAVRYGGIGFCKAARMFGVNNRTLWLEYKKRGYPNNRPSLKSRVKQEISSSPPPSAPTSSSGGGGGGGGGGTSSASSSSSQPLGSQSPTPMGPPPPSGPPPPQQQQQQQQQHSSNAHAMLATHSPHAAMLSGYIDSRHTDYSLPSPTMPINLHGVNYNAM